MAGRDSGRAGAPVKLTQAQVQQLRRSIKARERTNTTAKSRKDSKAARSTAIGLNPSDIGNEYRNPKKYKPASPEQRDALITAISLATPLRGPGAAMLVAKVLARAAKPAVDRGISSVVSKAEPRKTAYAMSKTPAIKKTATQMREERQALLDKQLLDLLGANPNPAPRKILPVSGSQMPKPGGAANQRLSQLTGRTMQEQKAAAGKPAVKKTVAEVRAERTRRQEQRVRDSAEHTYVDRNDTTTLSQMMEPRQSRLPRYSGVTNRDSIDATRRMIARKPDFTRNKSVRNARLAERNSPTRPGYRAPRPAERPVVKKDGRPGASMRAAVKPETKAQVEKRERPVQDRLRGSDSMRFRGSQVSENADAPVYRTFDDRTGEKGVEQAARLTKAEKANLIEERRALIRKVLAAYGKTKPKMTSASDGGKLSERLMKKELDRQFRILDELRLQRRRDADREAGRYGRTAAESKAAREKWVREHPKDASRNQMSPRVVEEERAARVSEGIAPVPSKPKPDTTYHRARETELTADAVRNNAEANPKAAEAAAAKEAAVAKPRPPTAGYVARPSAKERSENAAAVEAAQGDRAARDKWLRENPAALQAVRDAASLKQRAREARAEEVEADRIAAYLRSPKNVAAKKAQEEAAKAAAEQRAADAARDLEILMKFKPKKKPVATGKGKR